MKLSLVAIVVVLLRVFVHFRAVHAGLNPPANGQPQLLPFNPCRTSSKMTLASKKRITKLAMSLVSVCGLRIGTLIADHWGTPEEIVLITPKILRIMCICTRLMYSYFGDNFGRLQKQFMLNASLLYSTEAKLHEILFGDFSISSNVCTRNPLAKKRFCMPKSRMLDVLDFGRMCVREALQDTLAEYADATIHLLDMSVKIVQKNGLIRLLHG